MFRKNDQCRSRLIQPRVHPRSDLHPAREGEANVNAIVHAVGRERALDLGDDLFVRRNLRKGQRGRGTSQSMEMFLEFENAAVIKSQTFPHCIAALHRRIEWAYARLITMDQTAGNVED